MTFFTPLIDRWAGLPEFAGDVGCPVKTAREWRRNDSIPAQWFAAVVRAAISRGFREITADHLAVVAERRRLHREAADAAQGQAAA
jgi:hypothetical protein